MDARITESNSNNAALHERMNTLDAAVHQAKKGVADALARVKANQAQSKEAETAMEGVQGAQAALDARIAKLEAELRSRDSKERERRRTEKEKEKEVKEVEANSSSGGGGGSSGGDAPSDATTGSLTLSALEDRLRKDAWRAKVKATLARLEASIAEGTSSAQALSARLDALDQTRKKQVAEEKRRVEEAQRERDAAREAEEVRIKAVQDRFDAAHNSQTATLQALRAQVDDSQSRLAVLEQSTNAATNELSSLRDKLSSNASLSDQVNALQSSLSAATAQLQSGLTGVRSEIDALVARSNQSWALAQECNREIMVHGETARDGVNAKLRVVARTCCAQLRSFPLPVSALNSACRLSWKVLARVSLSSQQLSLRFRPRLPTRWMKRAYKR